MKANMRQEPANRRGKINQAGRLRGFRYPHLVALDSNKPLKPRLVPAAGPMKGTQVISELMEREVLLLAMLTGKGLIVAQSRPDYPPGTTRRTSKFGPEQRATCLPVADFDLTACVRGRARTNILP